MILLLVAGCASTPDSADSADPPALEVLALQDADNPGVTLDLRVGVLPLGEAVDGAVDWSTLTTSLRGDAVEPMRLGLLRLELVPDLDAAGVVAALRTGSLAQADIALSAMGVPGPDGPHLRLSQFTLGLDSFMPERDFVAAAGTWLLTLRAASGEALMFAILEPVPGGPEVADVVDTTATLVVAADLAARPGVAIAPGGARLDWSALTLDARGGALDASRLGTARLSRFRDSLDAATGAFPDHTDLADHTWAAATGGETSLDSTRLRDAEGASVPEIEAGWSWLLELGCAGCGELAPPVVVRLEPTAAP